MHLKEIKGDYQICCRVKTSYHPLKIVRNSLSRNLVIKVSDNYPDKKYLSNILKENNFYITESDNYSILIEKSEFSTSFLDFPELSFLNGEELTKYIVSDDYCYDSRYVCRLPKSTLSICYILVIVALLIMRKFNNNHFKPSFRMFDSKLNFVYAPFKEITKFHKKVLYRAIKKTNSSGEPECLTISMNRGFPEITFNKVCATLLKNGSIIVVEWQEKRQLEKKLDINCSLESSGSSKMVSCSVTIDNPREYHPINIKILTNYGANIEINVPIAHLSPFLSDGCKLSLLNSFLSDVQKLLGQSPLTDKPFSKFLAKYLKKLKIPRAIIVSNTSGILFQYPEYNNLKKEHVNELLSKLKPDICYVTELLPGCQHTYIRRTPTDIFLFGLATNHMPLIEDILPTFVLFIYYIKHVTITSKQFHTLDRVLKAMLRKNLYQYLEYSTNEEEDSVKSILSEFSNMKEDVCHRISTRDGLTYSEYFCRTGNNNETISYFAHDVTKLVQEHEKISNETKNLESVLKKLNLHKIYMKQRPSLVDGDKLTSFLGYPPSTPLLSMVHDQDISRLLNNGSSIPSNVKLASRSFDDDARIYYESYVNEKKIKNLNTNGEGSTDKNDIPMSETTCVRLISKRGKIFWYGVTSNKDIGYIYLIDDMVHSISLNEKPFQFTTGKVHSTYWIVNPLEDTVLPFYDLPTIWNYLGVDSNKPFSSFSDFLVEGSEKLKQGMTQLKEKRIETWSSDVLLKKVSVDPKWFKLSIFYHDNLLVCVLTSIKEVKSVTDMFQAEYNEVFQRAKDNGFYLLGFLDLFIGDSYVNFPIKEERYIFMSWGDLTRIPSEYILKFTKKIRNAMDHSHVFEMYVPFKLNDQFEYCLMIGRAHEKKPLLHGIIVPCPQLVKGIKSATEGELGELSKIARSIVATFRHRSEKTEEYNTLIEDAETDLRDLYDMTYPGTDSNDEEMTYVFKR